MANLAADLSVLMAGSTKAAKGPVSPLSSPPCPDEGQVLARTAFQMHTLALLYFPQLLPGMQKLHQAAVTLNLTMEEARKAAVATKESEAVKAAQEFAQARKAANLLIQQFASRYT